MKPQVFVGQRVRTAREAAGWSQNRMAELCDMHRTTYNQKENGVTSISVDELLLFADCLGVPIERFVEYGGEGANRCPTCRQVLPA